MLVNRRHAKRRILYLSAWSEDALPPRLQRGPSALVLGFTRTMETEWRLSGLTSQFDNIVVDLHSVNNLKATRMQLKMKREQLPRKDVASVLPCLNIFTHTLYLYMSIHMNLDSELDM